MTKEEKNIYLYLIQNCKEITDSIISVDGFRNFNILSMHLYKNGDEIHTNGYGSIGIDDNHENRYIYVNIRLKKQEIIVEMDVERLCVEDELKKYKIVDTFYIENGNLKRISEYSFDNKTDIVDINDEKVRGMIK